MDKHRLIIPGTVILLGSFSFQVGNPVLLKSSLPVIR